jgi:hypothetical protein
MVAIRVVVTHKDDNNESVGMLPTTLVSMTSYNATISATILVRHYDGKEKGEFEIQKVDVASFWQCYTRSSVS